jgi:dienelactone hydrolase
MAAYEFARRLPYVDGSRMILAGQSAGGVVALFTAGTRHPQGLRAVLAFSAGRGGDPVHHPGEPCAVKPLGNVFAEVGKQVKSPALFLYAKNDLFFNARVSRLWFDQFTGAGAKAKYVLQGPYGSNGHYVFSDPAGVRRWIPEVERFLAEYGVPFVAMSL